MSEMRARPPRKDPLARTRLPVPIPGPRSRAALGLAVGAAEGVFALQACRDCEAVQYPPRDVCGECLSVRLRWREVPAQGRLLTETTIRVPGERHFRERAPWRTGLVALGEGGPRLVAHLGEGCAVGQEVRLALRLDHAGRGAVFAAPVEGSAGSPGGLEDREGRADPEFRRALIVDGRASTAPALAAALARAGAERIFVGLAEAWRPWPARDAVAAIPGTEIVALDVTDPGSVTDLAGRIGDTIDILVCNLAHVRPGGLLDGADAAVARDTYEIGCLGWMRLASAFGPVMRSRTADGARASAAFATLISAWALAAPPEWAAYGAAQGAVRALSAGLRAETRASGLRVIDLVVGPIEDEWHQLLPPPKVRPEAIASALVRALREGLEEVVIGDVAREIHARWADDPRLLRHEGVR